VLAPRRRSNPRWSCVSRAPRDSRDAGGGAARTSLSARHAHHDLHGAFRARAPEPRDDLGVFERPALDLRAARLGLAPAAPGAVRAVRQRARAWPATRRPRHARDRAAIRGRSDLGLDSGRLPAVRSDLASGAPHAGTTRTPSRPRLWIHIIRRCLDAIVHRFEREGNQIEFRMETHA
jgi:hypothetical protein